jgi:hypothetical protein
VAQCGRIALEKAIAYTVTYCKEHGILKGFLENLSREEVNMLATEWNMENALCAREEEEIQKGETGNYGNSSYSFMHRR